MIHVFSMAYNESPLLQFMIDHYRSRFPNCNITIYDNESTDNTKQISLDNNCEVIDYCTNNTVDDDKLRNLKNSCWKSAKTDWVLVCDVDELLDITQDQLIEEQNKGTTIIKSEAYNMVNMYNNYDIVNIKHGSRCSQYDKDYLFNKKFLSEINYAHGGHSTRPVGKNIPSSTKYTCYHYTGICPELSYKKFQYTKARLSLTNKKYGWGSAYENDTRTLKDWEDYYDQLRPHQIKIRD